MLYLILKIRRNQLSLITVHTKLEIVHFTFDNIALCIKKKKNFEQYGGTLI